MEVLLGASLALSGIVTGIYISVMIHDRRIAELSAMQYAAMHQMRDKTFRVVMPPIALAMLALTSASTAFVLAPGLPRILGAVAATLMAIDIGLAATLQVPLNRRIQTWTGDAIPADWKRFRKQWAAQHKLRLLSAVAAYACLLAAVLLLIDIR